MGSNLSPHVRESNFRNPEKFCWALQSGIQLKESGIPQTIGIQNPSSTGKDQRLESSSWHWESTARNPGFRTVLDPLTRRETSISTWLFQLRKCLSAWVIHKYRHLLMSLEQKKINILVLNPMQIGAAVRWDLPTGSNPGVVVTCRLRFLMVISLALGGFSPGFFSDFNSP